MTKEAAGTSSIRDKNTALDIVAGIVSSCTPLAKVQTNSRERKEDCQLNQRLRICPPTPRGPLNE